MSVASSIGSPFKGNPSLYPFGAIGSSVAFVVPTTISVPSSAIATVFQITPPAGLYMFIYNPIVEGNSAPFDILRLYVDVDGDQQPYKYNSTITTVLIQPSVNGCVYVDGTQLIQFKCVAVSSDETNILIKSGSIIGLYCIG